MKVHENMLWFSLPFFLILFFTEYVSSFDNTKIGKRKNPKHLKDQNPNCYGGMQDHNRRVQHDHLEGDEFELPLWKGRYSPPWFMSST